MVPLRWFDIVSWWFEVVRDRYMVVWGGSRSAYGGLRVVEIGIWWFDVV
jgi:hypothetical protein